MHSASSCAPAELICTRIVRVCDETVRCSKMIGEKKAPDPLENRSSKGSGARSSKWNPQPLHTHEGTGMQQSKSSKHERKSRDRKILKILQIRQRADFMELDIVFVESYTCKGFRTLGGHSGDIHVRMRVKSCAHFFLAISDRLLIFEVGQTECTVVYREQHSPKPHMHLHSVKTVTHPCF